MLHKRFQFHNEIIGSVTSLPGLSVSVGNRLVGRSVGQPVCHNFLHFPTLLCYSLFKGFKDTGCLYAMDDQVMVMGHPLYIHTQNSL